ncbi:hypothetical protein M9458_052459 [Cirrhinus mrigala]|uniref:Uncharacterized protein n=1 Tax=Cirrhinus mrigala TaxID=683832 RepID=A0ABD0MW04_CIRMR
MFVRCSGALNARIVKKFPMALQATLCLNGRTYVAAGLTGGALHTVAILQAYQAILLKDLDENKGLSSEPVKELRCTTDLADRTTKQTAAVIGRSMAAMVAMERHPWVNHAAIRKKETDCLLCLLSPTGQIGTSAEADVDKFKKPRTQSAALKNFIPHWPKFASRGEICLKPRLTDESKSPALLTVPLLPLGVAEERLALIKGYRISGMC